MKTPFYRKTWFVRGLIVLLTGIFCSLYSEWHLGQLEQKYSDLGKTKTDLILEDIQNPQGAVPLDNKKATKEEVEELSAAKINYSRSKITIYFGYVLAFAGVMLMLISGKEREVPSIEDLDDDEDQTHTTT